MKIGSKVTKEDIERVVLANFSDQIEFLRSIVAEDSINLEGDKEVEVKVARIIRKKLTEMGVLTKYLRANKNRPNVLSSWGPIRSRKSVTLTGHMDIEEPLWGSKSDWFTPQIKGEKMYGAGVLDMKGSLAAYIFALKALMDLKIQPMGQLKLAFSVDGAGEKSSELGLKFLVKKGFKSGGALLAKPGLGKIAVGHRGGYRFCIKTKGESVNTGRKVWEKGEKGRNAVADMGLIMRKLSSFDLPYKPAKAFPGRVPVFTFPTKIVGGSAVNIVPDVCEAWGDVRLLPGNTDNQVRMWITDKLSTLNGVDWTLTDLFYVPAMEVEKSEKVVALLYESAKIFLPVKPKLEGCGPWNEAWVLTGSDTPCIAGFGPEGQEGDADHEEWIDLNSLKKFTMIVANMVYMYLGDKRERAI